MVSSSAAAVELQKLSKIIGAQLALAINDNDVDEPLLPQLTASIEQFDRQLRLGCQAAALTPAEIRACQHCLDRWHLDLRQVQQNCRTALQRGIRGGRARKSYLGVLGSSEFGGQFT